MWDVKTMFSTRLRLVLTSMSVFLSIWVWEKCVNISLKNKLTNLTSQVFYRQLLAKTLLIQFTLMLNYNKTLYKQLIYYINLYLLSLFSKSRISFEILLTGCNAALHSRSPDIIKLSLPRNRTHMYFRYTRNTPQIHHKDTHYKHQRHSIKT